MRWFCALIILYSSLSLAQITLVTLDGRHINLAQLASKKIVINYWANWCQPCIDEIQSLNRFYKNYQGKVALFAVNFDQPSLSAQRHAVEQFHIQYPSLASDPAILLSLGDISAVPATFIINHQGQLEKSLFGPQTEVSLTKELDL